MDHNDGVFFSKKLVGNGMVSIYLAVLRLKAVMVPAEDVLLLGETEIVSDLLHCF